MYQPHPSKKLNQLFRAKPHQGAEPDTAEFLFVGLDANYASDVEGQPSFKTIQQYHDDGVSFWHRHGVHHPFLLAEYAGAGRRYHQNFAKVGFTPKDAERVSFIELLHVPTCGRNLLSVFDLDDNHLNRVNRYIIEGAAKHIFVSAGVLRLMQAIPVFSWLPRKTDSHGTLKTVWTRGGKSIYLHLHFSNYGKFAAQMRREAEAIYALKLRSGQ